MRADYGYLHGKSVSVILTVYKKTLAQASVRVEPFKTVATQLIT
ncbi:protein of unknown function [Brochothrix thermosphacta]|nr:protein of unknown function [Brochothrix thermosphacta]